jgi:hypothetical protein
MPIDGFMGDVQAAAGRQSVEQGAGRVPGEAAAGGIVIGQIGPHSRRVAWLDDPRIALSKSNAIAPFGHDSFPFPPILVPG